MTLMDHLIFFPVLIPLLAGIALMLPGLHQQVLRQRRVALEEDRIVMAGGPGPARKADELRAAAS